MSSTDYLEDEGIIKELIEAAGQVSKVQTAVDKASGMLGDAQVKSMEKIAEILAKINSPIDKERAKHMAQSMAEAVATTADTLKSRKTEFLVLIEERAHVKDLIDKVKENVAERRKTDEKFSASVRQHVLAGLRTLRRDDKATVESVAAGILVPKEKKTRTDRESFDLAIDKLMGNALLKHGAGIHAMATHAIETLTDLTRGKVPTLEGFTEALQAYEATEAKRKSAKGAVKARARAEELDAVVATEQVVEEVQTLIVPATESDSGAEELEDSRLRAFTQ